MPSWGSVAPPENEMVSPTFQRSAGGRGLEMVAVGGVLPAVIVTESVSDGPRLSVTRSAGGVGPGCW